MGVPFSAIQNNDDAMSNQSGFSTITKIDHNTKKPIIFIGTKVEPEFVASYKQFYLKFRDEIKSDYCVVRNMINDDNIDNLEKGFPNSTHSYILADPVEDILSN